MIPAKFTEFCSLLRIDAKERGIVPLKLLGTQRYFAERVFDGLSRGIHTFVVLKGRQLGISTIELAVVLYWIYSHPGLQGALVTDTSDNAAMFRSILTKYIESLPRRARITQTEHNRTQLVLRNRSRLSYIVAGTKQNSAFGVGKALNFAHCTEVSRWGSEAGLADFMSSLAHQNPDRLYVYESTARGYNMFYEMCMAAQKSPSQEFIFVGWWLSEMNRIARDTRQYRDYWDGAPTSDEMQWIAAVKERYGVEIDDEQIAWWRWKSTEEIPDPQLMLQNFPPVEDVAFQESGLNFFDAATLSGRIRSLVVNPPAATYYRYHTGAFFEQTRLVDAEARWAELTVWEMPDPKGVYVIGADPAYGSSENADRFVIQVFRAYADRLIQVAEYCTADVLPHQYAWILCHLGGWYENCQLNLELTGPGTQVYNEIQNLRHLARSPSDGKQAEVYDIASNVRDFFYRRKDSLTRSVIPQWQTNSSNKGLIMYMTRDYLERGLLEVRSEECLRECLSVRQDGSVIEAPGRRKDDRVMAMALAVVAWNDWVMKDMALAGRTYLNETRDADPALTQSQEMFTRFLHLRGLA